MIPKHIVHIFKKDGLELLRDRRTLFVNVLLPVLLFPLICLFLVQVVQITNAQKSEPPRIAVIGDAPGLAEQLRHIQKKRAANVGEVLPPGGSASADVVDLQQEEAEALRKQIADAQDIAKRAKAEGKSGPLHDEYFNARAALLTLLRKQHLAAAIVATEVDGAKHVLVVQDDAHADIDSARAIIQDALDAYQRGLVDDNLRRAGLPRRYIEPLVLDHLSVATIAESMRSRLAGMIPMLLVIMAISGAFYPALDLLAGERERGTLESLLSWPVRRRDIFLGKLLVTCTAAILTVILNLSSGMLTFAVAGHQLGGSNESLASMLTSGVGVLAVSFIALLPLTITLSTISLALAGLAASAKEAQNYLSPLIIVVMVAAGVGGIPNARPNMALDLVPITGPVLALKESLRAANIPWMHLLLSTAASIALAVVVIGWAVRLLEDESFCYPGLVRAGWGRFRSWGRSPLAPNALEAMAVFAIAVGLFSLSGGAVRDLPAPTMIVAPLLAAILFPALVHAWLGDYSAKATLSLRAPGAGNVARMLAAIPFAVLLSLSIGMATAQNVPSEMERQLDEIFRSVKDMGGMPLLILCVAVAPALCEETLCRGTLLAGLRKSLGDGMAVFISAFLFAVLHLSPFRFLPQFVLGLALATVVVRSGSIFPAMLLHAGHNAVIVAMPTFFSWMAAKGWCETDADLGNPFMLAIPAVVGLAVCVFGCNNRNRSIISPGAS